MPHEGRLEIEMFQGARVQQLGEYVLGDRLGIGGMAEVFAAHSPRFGQVAVKRILPGLAQDQEFADMFWDEARITSRFEHPNIVRILDYGRVYQELFMALEYVSGPTLARVLRRAAKEKDPFPMPVLVGLMIELLDALDYVHTSTDERGQPLRIVHRDVSPGNLMMTEHARLKLGDFGIVRSEAVVRRTQPGELKGKIGYMSPEQALGGAISAQSDLFSVGIIMAEFLTLRPLFLGKNEMQTLSRTVSSDLSTWHRFNGHVPIPLRSVVERALKVDMGERYASAAQMRHELLDVARRAGWRLDPTAAVQLLQRLELLPKEGDASGERRIVRPPAPQDRPLEMATQAGHAGVLRRPQGRPTWDVHFSRADLPMQLMSAVRRCFHGVVELTHETDSLLIELRAGRVMAVHDSSGQSPLGKLLREAGLLDSASLTKAIGESRRLDLRLGEYLVVAGKVRESIVSRLLTEQATTRLAAWFKQPFGKLAVFLDPELPRVMDEDVEPASLADIVAAMRRGIGSEDLGGYLSGVMDSVVLPARGASVDPFGLTDPEARSLLTTFEGGSYEGLSVRTVIEGVERERIARRTEATFAMLVGLSAGVIHAPGFGR